VQLAARATGMDSQNECAAGNGGAAAEPARAPRVLGNVRHPARRAGGVARGDAGALRTARPAHTLVLALASSRWCRRAAMGRRLLLVKLLA